MDMSQLSTLSRTGYRNRSERRVLPRFSQLSRACQQVTCIPWYESICLPRSVSIIFGTVFRIKTHKPWKSCHLTAHDDDLSRVPSQNGRFTTHSSTCAESPDYRSVLALQGRRQLIWHQCSADHNPLQNGAATQAKLEPFL